MSITSLPGKYGIGCFSKEAYKFVDWLKDAGQTFWQILPVHQIIAVDMTPGGAQIRFGEDLIKQVET